MHEAPYPAVAELVPHRGRMSLLDAIAGHGADWIEARVTVRADSLFDAGTGTGAWVGIEYMAQTVAAFAGMRGRGHGDAPKLGFLVAARSYECEVAEFARGRELRVRAVHRFETDSGVGSFACSIHSAAGELLARSTLTVFEPADPAAVLAGATT